jgi:hypothetical protein
MNKIQKRLAKLSKHSTNAMVIGNAFGFLSSILSIYRTIFIAFNYDDTIRAKNLIYRENIDNLNNITDIGALFFDRNNLNKLESLRYFWTKNNSVIFIEGNEVIDRDHSKPLYDSGWRCTSQQGYFHVWEKTQ